jgi:putative flippase GtrA
MISKIFEPKVLKYLFVGICTVAIDYLAIFIIYSVSEMNYMIAIVGGFLMSNIFQFYMNFFYTFSLKKDDQLKQRIIMYIISSSIGMLLGTLSVISLKYFIDSLYICKTLSLLVSFLYGFIASKYIVFNNKVNLNGIYSKKNK